VRKLGLKAILPLVIFMAIVPILFFLVMTTTEPSLTLLLDSAIASSIAGLMAIIGLVQFGRGGIFQDDTFHMMNVDLTLSLAVFAVAEVVGIAVGELQEGSPFYYAMAVLFFIGTILWSFGVITYLHSCNGILAVFSSRIRTSLFVLASIVPTIIIILLNLLMAIPFTLIVVIAIPLDIIMTATTLALLTLTWAYRRGALVVPFITALIAAILVLIRSLPWCCNAQILIDPLSQLISTEVYILMGATLVSARNSEALVS
jgi:hypothetical protein